MRTGRTKRRVIRSWKGSPRIKSTTGVHGGRFINLSRVILALTFHGSVHDPFKSSCGDKSNWQIRLSAYTLVALERHIYVSRFT